MFSSSPICYLRITPARGHAWTVAMTGDRVEIGRGTDTQVTLDDSAVSRRHAVLEFDGARFVLHDLGTANGTFVNHQVLTTPRIVAFHELIDIGPFRLELVPLDHGGLSNGKHAGGPLLRSRGEDHRQWSLDRLERWATEWDAARRPRRLLLRGRLLADARTLVASNLPSPLVGMFVTASRRRLRRRRAATGVMVVGLAVVVAGVVTFRADADTIAMPWWPGWGRSETPSTSTPTEAPSLARIQLQPPSVNASSVSAEQAAEVEHRVIPAETLEDIAQRYDVSVERVAEWNRLNRDDPKLEVGQRLKIKARHPPLPQQQIEFELDRNYDWKSLSDRFDVSVDKLRAYNPELERLAKGERITVWINPKPHRARTEMLDVPAFDVRSNAISIGRPNKGKLSEGIQMPQSSLYIRRAPFIMWGSSYTIETLMTAIARFRQRVAFDGELVVADISKRRGGVFPPHKSHQAGRDVDIWMPTLKGVYKENYLGRDRKPQPDEIDWFATWGLVRALIETERVVHIFLEYSLQEKLYRAALEMGATDDELERAMQWPRGQYASGIVGHSAGHTGHIHVRFKCGPLDEDCRNDVARDITE